jgi:hypothetical protein
MAEVENPQQLSVSQRAAQSMIPKSGYRFSVKIMPKLNNLDRDPIQLNWIMV